VNAYEDFIRGGEGTANREAVKPCPHCAEQIQDAAKVCPHCRRNLGMDRKSLASGFGCLTLIGLLGMGWCVNRFSDPIPASRSTSNTAAPAATARTPEPKPADRKSPTCRRISGETSTDLDHLAAFCTTAIPKGLEVVSARAHSMLLWIQIPRELADTMRADRLSTESVVKTWMTVWRQVSGSSSVTVYVRWQDVEIAKGESTLFSGDVVTIK
jgi:hypothetical protein